jgi:hypothetical protein
VVAIDFRSSVDLLLSFKFAALLEAAFLPARAWDRRRQVELFISLCSVSRAEGQHAQDGLLVRQRADRWGQGAVAARDDDELETASHSVRDQPAKAGAVTDGMRLRDRDTAFDQEALCRGKEARGSTRA